MVGVVSSIPTGGNFIFYWNFKVLSSVCTKMPEIQICVIWRFSYHQAYMENPQILSRRSALLKFPRSMFVLLLVRSQGNCGCKQNNLHPEFVWETCRPRDPLPVWTWSGRKRLPSPAPRHYPRNLKEENRIQICFKTFIMARIRSTTGRYCFYRCLSVNMWGGDTPSPSHNTSTSPMSFPGDLPQWPVEGPFRGVPQWLVPGPFPGRVGGRYASCVRAGELFCSCNSNFIWYHFE